MTVTEELPFRSQWQKEEQLFGEEAVVHDGSLGNW